MSCVQTTERTQREPITAQIPTVRAWFLSRAQKDSFSRDFQGESVYCRLPDSGGRGEITLHPTRRWFYRFFGSQGDGSENPRKIDHARRRPVALTSNRASRLARSIYERFKDRASFRSDNARLPSIDQLHRARKFSCRTRIEGATSFLTDLRRVSYSADRGLVRSLRSFSDQSFTYLCVVITI